MYKNNRGDSNFFLKDKQLQIEYKKTLRILRTYTYSKSRVSSRELRAAALARASIPAHLENSLIVTPAGFEPAIFWMRTRRPGPLDDGAMGSIVPDY